MPWHERKRKSVGSQGEAGTVALSGVGPPAVAKVLPLPAQSRRRGTRPWQVFNPTSILPRLPTPPKQTGTSSKRLKIMSSPVHHALLKL